MENEDKVLFDPGYAPLVMDSIGQVGYTYYTFNAISNLKLKRQSYPIISIKLEKLLKTNIAFYLGCLLWASYISKFDKEIIGNKLLNEETNEEEYTSEINFLIDFVQNQMPRDYKYYKNKIYNPDERFLNILNAYKDFLILNDGFVNCSKTSQIKLPESLKKLQDDEYEKINSGIQEAIKEKNLEKLFDFYSFIF